MDELYLQRMIEIKTINRYSVEYTCYIIRLLTTNDNKCDDLFGHCLNEFLESIGIKFTLKPFNQTRCDDETVKKFANNRIDSVYKFKDHKNKTYQPNSYWVRPF